MNRRIDPTTGKGLTVGDKSEPNAALREIAGRLQKLSYRDMQRLAGLLLFSLPSDRVKDMNDRDVADAILDAAMKMENA